jgi:hypothetical protein
MGLCGKRQSNVLLHRADAAALLKTFEKAVNLLRQVLSIDDSRPPVITGAGLPIQHEDEISMHIAVARSQRDATTIRRWCVRYGIGYKRGKRWVISSSGLTKVLKGELG